MGKTTVWGSLKIIDVEKSSVLQRFINFGITYTDNNGPQKLDHLLSYSFC